MVQSLNRRFGNIESNETLVLATMLDPCFKDKIFSGVAERDTAKSMLVDKVNEILPQPRKSQEEKLPVEPPEKRQKTTVMDVFYEKKVLV